MRPRILLDHLREMNEPGIEKGHLFWRGTLLRAVDMSRARHTNQWIVDIANGLDANAANARVEPCVVDARDAMQGSTDGLDFLAVFVEEPNTEGCRHSGSPVIGGAAADADADTADAQFQSRGDELAGPPGRGSHRIPTVRWHQGETARQSHLDGGEAHNRNMAEGGLDRFAERSRHRMCSRQATHRLQRDVHQAVAAIGDRDLHDLHVRDGPRDASRHGFRRLPGRKASFEGVGGDDDPHPGSSANSYPLRRRLLRPAQRRILKESRFQRCLESDEIGQVPFLQQTHQAMQYTFSGRNRTSGSSVRLYSPTDSSERCGDVERIRRHLRALATDMGTLATSAYRLLSRRRLLTRP